MKGNTSKYTQRKTYCWTMNINEKKKMPKLGFEPAIDRFGHKLYCNHSGSKMDASETNLKVSKRKTCSIKFWYCLQAPNWQKWNHQNMKILILADTLTNFTTVTILMTTALHILLPFSLRWGLVPQNSWLFYYTTRCQPSKVKFYRVSPKDWPP